MLSISRYSYIGPFSLIHMQFWPIDLSLGSFKVIWGQIRFLPLTFERIHRRHRALGIVPICFFRKNASTYMQYDLLDSTRDLTWPWPEVQFWPWPFKVKMYKFRRVLTKGARCCQNYASNFISSKVIRLNLFCKKKKRYFDLSWTLKPKPLNLCL